MDGISRSRGWDKEIPHGVLPMEKLVLSDKWARKSIHHDVLLWDKEIPPSDLNNFVTNSAEPRF